MQFFSEKDTFFRTLIFVSIISVIILFVRIYIVEDYKIFESEDQIDVWSLEI